MSATDSVDINFSKTFYSNNVNFQGDFIINGENLDVDETVTADVSGCGSFDAKSIELYDLLINAGVDIGPREAFTAGGSSSTYQSILGNNESELVGLLINQELNSLNFSVAGSGSGFFIDVGADGDDDWHYVGAFSSWGVPIHSDEYDGTYDLTDIYEINPHSSKCNNFEIDFDELVDDLLIKVDVFAKGAVVGEELVARMGGQSCVLEGVGTNDWALASCEITLNSERYDSPVSLETCVWSSGNGFRIPSRVGSEFYFTKLSLAEYDETLGSQTYLSDSNLMNAVNSFYEDCAEDWCLVPLELKLVNSGQVNFGNLLASAIGGSEFTLFHAVNSEAAEWNGTGKKIPLRAFTDLKTPDVEEDICALKMSFDNKHDEAIFNVSAGPIPVIESSSFYMAK